MAKKNVEYKIDIDSIADKQLTDGLNSALGKLMKIDEADRRELGINPAIVQDMDECLIGICKMFAGDKTVEVYKKEERLLGAIKLVFSELKIDRPEEFYSIISKATGFEIEAYVNSMTEMCLTFNWLKRINDDGSFER